MVFSWDDSRRAFTDAAEWFVRTAARVGDRWNRFELAVHTTDLATALGVPSDVPATAAAQALHVVADLAVAAGLAGPLLLAATGRPGLPAGFSVL